MAWLFILLTLILPRRALSRGLLLSILSLVFLWRGAPVLWFWTFICWTSFIYLLVVLVFKGRIQRNVAVRSVVFVGVASFVVFKLRGLGGEATNLVGDYAVPIGFSFAFFQGVALLLDIGTDRLKKIPNPLAVFGAHFFFPTVTVGPFIKAQPIFDGLERPSESPAQFFSGYCLFCLGAFKFAVSGVIAEDMLVALPIGSKAGLVYAPLGTLLIVGTTYLYMNFSGFSDMGVGLARAMGFDVPQNFQFPFLARSMAEYWQRWHISLGAWFREYVFFPINYELRKSGPESPMGKHNLPISVFITFLLIGLWHGISMKFLFWALVNSLMVTFVRTERFSRWLSIPVTVLFVMTSNLLFLSKDLETFFSLMVSAPQLISTRYLEIKSLGTVGICLCSLFLAYMFEKAILRCASVQAKSEPRRWLLNLLAATLTLGTAILLGVGRVDSVYVGY